MRIEEVIKKALPCMEMGNKELDYELRNGKLLGHLKLHYNIKLMTCSDERYDLLMWADRLIKEFMFKDEYKNWRREVEHDHDDFVEKLTRENPQWVMKQRVAYFENQEYDLKREAEYFTEGINRRNKKGYQWLAEITFEDDLSSIFKKLKKIRRQIALWKSKEYVSPKESITEDDIDDAKSVSCAEFVEISQEQSGRSWAICPLHNEKTPSFCCFGEGKGYYCFGCGSGGDSILLVQKLHNLNFIEAVKYIINK